MSSSPSLYTTVQILFHKLLPPAVDDAVDTVTSVASPKTDISSMSTCDVSAAAAASAAAAERGLPRLLLLLLLLLGLPIVKLPLQVEAPQSSTTVTSVMTPSIQSDCNGSDKDSSLLTLPLFDFFFLLG
jgi:hypothetical protein